MTNRDPETIRRNIENTMKTKSLWSAEKRQKIIQNAAKAGRAFWASLSEEERYAKTRAFANRYSLLSEEEKIKYRDDCKKRHFKINTPEWRKRIADTCKALWDEDKRKIQSDRQKLIWNEDKKQQHSEIQKASIAAMSKEKKEQHAENVRVAITKMWENIDSDKKQERLKKLWAGKTKETNEKIRKARLNASLTETPEEKAQRIQAHKKGAKNTDWVEVQKRVQATKDKWSEEQKAEHSKKMSINANRRWNKVKNNG